MEKTKKRSTQVADCFTMDGSPSVQPNKEIQSMSGGNNNGTPLQSAAHCRIMHINIQSLACKVPEVDSFIENLQHKPSILAMTEHWLKVPNIALCSLEGYSLTSCFCRVSSSHGGVAIYSRKDLNWPLEPLEELSKMSQEGHCEIAGAISRKQKFVIIAVYRPPKGSFTAFLDTVDSILDSMHSNQYQVILTGDFNVNFLDPSNLNLHQLESLIGSYGYWHVLSQPTRLKSCLDNFITNIPNSRVLEHAVINACLSDHDAIQMTIAFNKTRNETHFTLARPISSEKIDRLRRLVSAQDWTFIENSNYDIDEKWTNFMAMLKQCINSAIPKKMCRTIPRTKRKFEMSEELNELRQWLAIINELCKNPEFVHLKKTKTALRRKYRVSLIAAKQKANEDFIKSANNKQRAYWGLIKSKVDTPTVKPAPNENDLNTYFAEVPQELANKLPLTKHNPLDFATHESNFDFRPCTSKDTRSCLLSMKNSKSEDIYGMSMSIIRELHDIIDYPLTSLINESINQDHFPNALKHAIVIPVHKKGDIHDCHNYRPISLLPVISKPVEKILHHQLAEYLEIERLLATEQFGFRKDRNTSLALLHFINGVVEGFEEKESTVAMFYDLQKAFDCLSPEILLGKLPKYGLSRGAVSLIKSYLNGRTKQVKGEGKLSAIKDLKCGVPQGSILGPLLFLVYVNDLPSFVPEAKFTLFADDTTVSIRGKSPEDLIPKREELNCKVKEWFIANKLSTNDSKTCNLFFSLCHNLETSPFMTEVKLLGIMVDNKLNWHSQINHLHAKLSKVLFLLRRLKENLTKVYLLQAYYAMFHSIMSYGVLVWGHSPCADDIFKIQRKAVRVIYDLKYQEDCVPSFKQSKILTLPSEYILQCLIFVKCNKDKYCRRKDVHQYPTRSCNDLDQELIRRNRCRTGINYWGAKFYNSLPSHIQEAPVKKFRNEVKKLLQESACYSFDQFIEKR